MKTDYVMTNKSVIEQSIELDQGLFSRVKQIPGLISSQYDQSKMDDKARFVFVVNPQDFYRNDDFINVHERGSSNRDKGKTSWKIDHNKHICKHEGTAPDKDFINRFSNYSKTGKRLGGNPRCYEHKQKNEKCCTDAKNKENKLMCDDHNGWDCCGMVLTAKISQFPKAVSKDEIIMGALCTNESDKELIEELSQW